MPTVYATHSFVQETADEVIVSFFEVVHPIINPAEKEEGAKLLRETGVVAECVARITIAKHKFPEMAQGFAETAKRILDRFGEIVNADDKSNNPEDS